MDKQDWSVEGKSRSSRRASKETSTEDNPYTAPMEENMARRKKGKSNRVVYMTVLFISLLLGAIYLGFQFTDRLLAVGEGDLTENPAAVDELDKKKDVLSVLMIGTDQRANEAARSDTLILAILNKKTKEVNLISIPRDTRAAIPGRGTEKINHAYAYGRAPLVTEAVEQLLDIKLDGYVSTNFNGFANIIDIIGGVDYNVEMRMHYPAEQINLQKGEQKLDGDKALQYVRFRSDGRGDIGRMERQQKFLKAVADQLLSTANILKIPSLVKEVNENIKTNISAKDLVTVANTLRSVKTDSLHTHTLPGDATYIKGVSYWEVNKKEVAKLLEEIYNPKVEKTEDKESN